MFMELIKVFMVPLNCHSAIANIDLVFVCRHWKIY